MVELPDFPLRTWIVRCAFVSAVLLASLFIGTQGARAHDDGPSSEHGFEHFFGHHHWHGHGHWQDHDDDWWGEHGDHACHSGPEPTAEFNAAPEAPVAGRPVVFDASASTGGATAHSSGTIVSYSWDFGDGTVGDSATATHAYDAPGTYVVELTVTNDAGNKDTLVRSFTVAERPKPKPTAGFSFSPQTPIAGRPAQFDSSASSGGTTDDGLTGQIVTYNWDFGDQSSDVGAAPSHAFAAAGAYSVSLTVTNDYGQSDTVSHDVNVVAAPAPTAAFSFEPLAPVAERPVSFDASTSNGGVADDGTAGQIVDYSWMFGDGATSTAAAPSHVYAAAGQFVVSLTVTNDFGKSSTATQTLSVLPAPPPYDPGGGPRLADRPASVTPLSPQVVTSSATAKGKIKFGVRSGFALPNGADPATACLGDVIVTASIAKTRGARGKAALSPNGGGCEASAVLRLPKSFSGKKAKFAFSFAGNGSVAAWSMTRRLKVK
jgi:PKD repeat protein